jgi:hypothetical protein
LARRAEDEFPLEAHCIFKKDEEIVWLYRNIKIDRVFSVALAVIVKSAQIDFSS